MNPTFANACFDLIFVDLGLFISIIISLNSIKVVVISIVVVTVGQFVEVEVVGAGLKKWSWFFHIHPLSAIKNRVGLIFNQLWICNDYN